MAISKRLRFEVLKRDRHTCQSCGRKAPDVPLQVDHVIPVALGGTDEPTNLSTKCEPCNTGKSSASADAAEVAQVEMDAARWSAAIQQAAEENRLHDNTEAYERVVAAWTSYRRNRDIPGDYRETIDQFLAAGLPADDIVQMAHVADAKPNIYDRWAYFCGCCWTRIRKLQERATEILSHSACEKLAAPLTTRWTAAQVTEKVSKALSFADAYLGDEEIAMYGCEHQDGPGHCGDPICAAVYAADLEWVAVDRSNEHAHRFLRDDRIMSELEELEELELLNG